MDAIKGLFYYQLDDPILDQVESFLSEIKNWEDGPGRRKVLQFGRAYSYSKRSIGDLRPEFPQELKDLLTLIPQKFQKDYNQCIINQYKPGENITPHIDHRSFGPVICCFSFGCSATMRFQVDDEIYDLRVKGKSLYIMSEDARSRYTHCMRPTSKGIRYSITFRTIN